MLDLLGFVFSLARVTVKVAFALRLGATERRGVRACVKAARCDRGQCRGPFRAAVWIQKRGSSDRLMQPAASVRCH